MYEHLREHQLLAVEEEIKASKRAAGVLDEGNNTSGNASPSRSEIEAAKIKCEYCSHESDNDLQLQQHKIFNHTTQILENTQQQSNPLTLFAWQQFLLTNSNFPQQ
uniref:Uncharacterized protein n=1 Tax=Panagrolaimus sp. ES5 TaxID=591445 RepID=A0AC34GEM7_9BILA